jgi:hypothetical protein
VLSIAGSFIWMAAASCHEFHACYDDSCDAAPPSSSSGAASTEGGDGAGSGETGGLGGRGNDDRGGDGALPGGTRGGDDSSAAGAPQECVAPHADCDESKLTGCETNLLTDVSHCGACRALCVGACVNGVCRPFERLSMYMDLPEQGGIAETNSELFVLSNDGYDSLLRWSEEAGATILISEGTPFEQVVVGADRVYLNSDVDELWSLPLSGGPLQYENQGARQIASVAGRLYAIDELGVPYELSATGQRRDLPLPAPIDRSRPIVLTSDGYDLALLVDTQPTDDVASYSAYYLDVDGERGWEAIANDSGSPVQARYEAGGSLYVSVLIGDSGDDEQKQYELREHVRGGETRVLATLAGVVDFEQAFSNLYVSVERPGQKSALVILSIDDPEQMVEVETSTTMRSLTYVSPYFYFGEQRTSRFSRLRSWQ